MSSKKANHQKAFCDAVEKNNVQGLKRLFACDDSSKQIDVDKPLKTGQRPLSLAASNNNVEVVRLLLENGARIDLKDNESSMNCLEVAALLGSRNMVHLCLQSVADDIYGLKYPKAFTAEPLSPRRHLSDYKYNIFDIVKFLLNKRADPNRDPDNNGLTPLHAVMKIDCSSLEEIEEEYDARSSEDLQISLVKLLLRYGADPNIRELHDSLTAFERSFKYRDPDLIDCFIAHGANVASKNNTNTAVCHAVELYMPQVLQRLINMNINVNEMQFASSSCFRTPLHLLFSSKDGFYRAQDFFATANLLIDQGGDVNALNSNNETPLCKAAHSKYLKAVRFLLSKGARVNGHEQNSPLFGVVTQSDSNLRTINFLIDNGANANCRDRYGRSLLHYAMRDNRKRAMITLLLRGARIGDDREGLAPSQFEFLTSCQNEVLLMQRTKISEKRNTTYLDILRKRRGALVNCIRFAEVYSAMESGAYRQMFGILEVQLKSNYLSGLQRMLMQDDLQVILVEVFEAVFPKEIIFMIMDYLSDEDLEDIFKCKCYAMPFTL